MSAALETCPECAGAVERDVIDVGVGEVRGPARCDGCGWSEPDPWGGPHPAAGVLDVLRAYAAKGHRGPYGWRNCNGWGSTGCERCQGSPHPGCTVCPACDGLGTSNQDAVPRYPPELHHARIRWEVS